MSLFTSTKHVGFTGTQKGMTDSQKNTVDILLYNLSLDGFTRFHHGDCIGADTEAHWLAIQRKYYIIVHPPIISSKASNLGVRPIDQPIVYRHQPKLYLDRNHDIVDASEILIVCPKEREQVIRSGTWATYRYAKKQNKKIYLILP